MTLPSVSSFFFTSLNKGRVNHRTACPEVNQSFAAYAARAGITGLSIILTHFSNLLFKMSPGLFAPPQQSSSRDATEAQEINSVQQTHK